MGEIRNRLSNVSDQRKYAIRAAGKVTVIKHPSDQEINSLLNGGASEKKSKKTGKDNAKKLQKNLAKRAGKNDVKGQPYIFLDCFTNLDSVSKLYRNSCDIPLKDQFQELKKKIPVLNDNFASFIGMTIPTTQLKYKFTKIGPIDIDDSTFQKVMITGQFKGIPEPYKLILVGDISTKQFPYSIVITRIELLDKKLIPPPI